MVNEIRNESSSNEKRNLALATIVTYGITFLFVLLIEIRLMGFDLNYVGNFEELGFGEWSEAIVVATFAISAGLWYVFIHFVTKLLFNQIYKK